MTFLHTLPSLPPSLPPPLPPPLPPSSPSSPPSSPSSPPSLPPPLPFLLPPLPPFLPQVCSEWLGSGVSRNIGDLQRVQQLLVSSLEKLRRERREAAVYGEAVATMESLAVLKAWAEVGGWGRGLG